MNTDQSDESNNEMPDTTASEVEPLVVDESFPRVLPLFPISNRPLLPGAIAPLLYDGEEYTSLIRDMVKNKEQYIALTLVCDDEAESTPDNFCRVGVLARLIKAAGDEHDHLQLLVECIQRVQIVEFMNDAAPFHVTVAYAPEPECQDNTELRAYSVAMINTIKELLKHNPLYEEELKRFLNRYRSDKPGMLADFAANLTSADGQEMQGILETYSLFDRVKKVLSLLDKEVNVSRLQNRIRKNIDERVAEQQRKYFLREQLEEIRRELGLNEDPTEKEIIRLRKKASTCVFSDEAATRFEEEINKLAMIDPNASEYGMCRSYLDCLCSLPWGKHAKDSFAMKRASRALNRHHAGLQDIKDRILEFIAVGGRRNAIGGSIILFVGPPGVGKTSIGRAIASALNRPFFRFSVGGMRDEAEIKGHRRTYIGAMPGKILQALKQVEVDNPVLMIDELDKIGTDARGDPASALLEVLDPEQSCDFLDHYLDVRFDLSRVLFLLTANDLWQIPAALRNRAEVIHLPGYLNEEKKHIASRHLWPKLLDKNAFSRKEVKLTPATLNYIIDRYAREPGVRRLEQKLEKILRRTARRVAEGSVSLPIRIQKKDVQDYLGLPRRKDTVQTLVGTAVGMAWTSMGGTLLNVEAITVHQERRELKTTGRLGKVMQESSDIAFSFLMANAASYGVSDTFFSKRSIHLHVPEGAISKDGPSAGITMATALLSLALNRAPRLVAMTGELTLTGCVLVIGGLREKLLAAKHMHIHEAIVPAGNRVDVEEFPDHVCKGMIIHYVDDYNQVRKILFPR
ncbi:MAG: endopeptidase La [Mariprofundaceae bacterium]|nr:endopeptidase La [Mariprofundaceae bacterium]